MPKLFNLTECQQYGLGLLRGPGNVFLSGEAGTGKSYLIKHYVQSSPDNIVTLASTGSAALLVGGVTYHSFFGLGFADERESDDKIIGRAVARIKNLWEVDQIVIDEVSMLSGRLMRLGDAVARGCRDKTKPWGGIKIIAVGDFMQLPPVSSDNKGRPDWAFASETWKRSNFQPAILQTKMRSNDNDLNAALSSIRVGELSKRTRKFLETHSKPSLDPRKYEHTFILPKKRQVADINNMRLRALPGNEHVLTATFSGDERYYKALADNSNIPGENRVKLGALVMLRINSMKEGVRYANGTVGHILKIGPSIISIELLDGSIIDVVQHTFETKALNPSTKELKSVAKMTCFPFHLAYAITIHKAQGTTLENAAIDLTGLWEFGQAYTALSRLKSAEGLSILNWEEDSIFHSNRAMKFYQKCLEEQQILQKQTAHLLL